MDLKNAIRFGAIALAFIFGMEGAIGAGSLPAPQFQSVLVTPNASTLNQGFQESQSVSGSASADYFANPLTLNFGGLADPGHNVYGFGPTCNVTSASFQGQMFCGYTVMNISTIGTPGFPNDQFIGHLNLAIGSANTTDADASIYAGNDNAQITGTGWTYLVGREIDMTVLHAITNKIGLKISEGPLDAFQGSTSDAAIELFNASGAVGWKRGFDIEAGTIAAGGYEFFSPNAAINANGFAEFGTDSLLPASGVPLLVHGATNSNLTVTNNGGVVDVAAINDALSAAVGMELASSSLKVDVLSTQGAVCAATGGILSTVTGNCPGQSISSTLTIGTTPVSGGTAGLPLLAGTTLAQGTISGNTTKFATASGILTSGHCVQFDSNGNVVDAGGACTTGGGGGTVSAGTINDLAYYSATGTAVTGLATANSGVLVTSGAGVPSISTTLPNMAHGTPTSIALTNGTGLPVSTGISGLGTGVGTFLATPSSANLAAALTDETGTGAAVFANSPTLVTPALGTPASGVATNLTGTASGLTAGNATAAVTATTASAANAINSATTTVNVNSGTAPSTGQVLKATDSTHATWQSLGTASTQSTGTSGATLPFLNGNNTESGNNSHTGSETFAEVIGTDSSQTGTTYTLAATDCGTEVDISNASAVTVTIPSTLPVGCRIAIEQDGAGQVAVNGSAVTPATLHNRQSFTKTAGQYAIIGISIKSTGVAILTGDGA